MKVHCALRKGEIVKSFGSVIQTEFSQFAQRFYLNTILFIENNFIKAYIVDRKSTYLISVTH